MAFGGTVLDTEAGAGIADSLISESFMVFLYGISVAVVRFGCEIFTRWMASVQCSGFSLHRQIFRQEDKTCNNNAEHVNLQGERHMGQT